jgi:hypothetical protein
MVRIHNTYFSSYLSNETNKLVLHYTRLQRLDRDKRSSLLGSLVSYKDDEVLYIGLPGGVFTTLHCLPNLQIGPTGWSFTLH